jgi:phosphoglycolate phosphatase-like HAD superfamily hydrolase
MTAAHTLEATGTLSSGASFRANRSMIEVIYPEGDRPPVLIDLEEVHGVTRDGSAVTLSRAGGVETTLRATELSDAIRLHALVREVVSNRATFEFDNAIIRLHANGYRLIAATPRLAQMIQPKSFGRTKTALVIMEPDGQVSVRYT